MVNEKRVMGSLAFWEESVRVMGYTVSLARETVMKDGGMYRLVYTRV